MRHLRHLRHSHLRRGVEQSNTAAVSLSLFCFFAIADMAQAAGYVWDDESLEIIQEWKEWKDKFSVFIQQLKQNGPANTKYPKKPKRSIESLSPTKTSEPLFGKHLHDYLFKKLHQAAFQ